jgi:hypothetical protein
MTDTIRTAILPSPSTLTEVSPLSEIGGDMCRRGGRVDIDDSPGKVDEALEESFPASDAPCFTQAGVSSAPPPRRR